MHPGRKLWRSHQAEMKPVSLLWCHRGTFVYGNTIQDGSRIDNGLNGGVRRFAFDSERK